MCARCGNHVVNNRNCSEAEPIVELEKLEHALSDKALETDRVRAIGVSVTTTVKVLDILAKEEIWL